MKFTTTLAGLAGLAVVSAAEATPPCPLPGATNAAGEYSCNPAHQYPSGQTCAPIGGCYYLRGMGNVPPTSSSSAQLAQSCPPAGDTNAAGEYSCNPAHQYPSGQTCAPIGGCYYLRGMGGVPLYH